MRNNKRFQQIVVWVVVIGMVLTLGVGALTVIGG